jgi:putative ABC transport system permease protein
MSTLNSLHREGRSVGASKADILLQFLLESSVITAVGGLVGTGLGVALIYIVGELQKVPFIFSARDLASAAALSVLVGLVFGMYPAGRAARTDPIAALRT